MDEATAVTIERRLGELEQAFRRINENGPFLRKDLFEILNRERRESEARLEKELGEIRAEIKADKEAREDDRKGVRNLLLGALFAAAGSLIVSILVGLANRA